MHRVVRRGPGVADILGAEALVADGNGQFASTLASGATASTPPPDREARLVEPYIQTKACLASATSQAEQVDLDSSPTSYWYPQLSSRYPCSTIRFTKITTAVCSDRDAVSFRVICLVDDAEERPEKPANARFGGLLLDL